jgi:glyoxylase-like metal-dependent hydrolase (beta-lactamase superfamily II)
MSETASAAVAYPAAASVPRAGVGLEPDVTGFYDEATGSVQYLVADPIMRRCAIIDPVLDFDPTSGATRTTSADRLLRHIEARGLTLEWILDTHPHADHFSAAGYLKDVTGAPTAVGERVIEVQKIWKKLYNLPETFPTDGSQWDHLFADGERFAVGAIEARALLSPGCPRTDIWSTSRVSSEPFRTKGSRLFREERLEVGRVLLPAAGRYRVDRVAGLRRGRCDLRPEPPLASLP